MEQFSCPKCSYSTTKSINSLRIHYTKSKHGSAEELWQLFYNDGKPVTCKCGCGESTKFLGIGKGYAEWKRGHVARIKNNWGHNDKAQAASIEKRRQLFKAGELEVWNKGLTAENDERIAAAIEKMNTPERARKISKTLTGVPKSKKHRQKIQAHMCEYWSNPVHQEEQRQRRLDYMSAPGKWRCYGTCHQVMHEGRELFLKSNFELQAFNHFCAQDDIERIEYEPIRIRCDDKRIYLPDFVITMKNGKRRIIEIKSEFYCNDPKWEAKELAAWRYAAQHNYTFEIWTEKTHPFLSRKPE